MKVEIKSYDSGSSEEICRIHNKGFSEWIDSLGILYGYQSISENDVKKWLDNDNNHILIAYDDELPVGYLHYQVVKTIGEKNDITSLEIVETTEGRGQSKIVVIPEKRRNGTALMLLRHVLNTSKQENIDVVIIYAYNHNVAINNILPKLGFTHERIFYYHPFSNCVPLAHDSILAEFDLFKELALHQNSITDEIVIREFQSTDLEDIQQIFIECRPDIVENSRKTDIGALWLKENWAKKTLVAEIQGEVVGCMEYNKYGLIGIPGVKKNYQKKGIGSKLLSHLLQDMKSNGYSKALADTGVILSNATKLYRKLNFDISRELWAWVKVI